MTQGLTGAVTGAASRQANTASTANMTLPAAPMVATYPITGVANITSITAGQSGQVALLEFASTGCRVVMGGNLLINGDYLSIAGGILTLVANGSNWEEVARTSSIIQPYNAAPNGDFRVWQRPFTTGSQFTSSPDGQYTADRWITSKAGTAVWDVVRDTSLPTVAYNMPGSLYSYKVNVTTADASIAATELYSFYSLIEGYDFQPLANGFAASWWAKAHRTGTYCLTFANRATNRSYIVDYTIGVADTWQYFTAVIPAPTGVWNYDSNGSMFCMFSMAGGSNWVGTAGTWNSSNVWVSANQINGVAATTDTLSVWGLNVVPGTVPQPLTPVPFAIQWGRLQRYYQVIVNAATTPVGHGHCLTTTRFFITRPLVEMGGTPSIIISAAGDFSVYNQGTAIIVTAIANFVTTARMLWLDCNVASGLAAGDGTMMYGNTGTSRMATEWNPA